MALVASVAALSWAGDASAGCTESCVVEGGKPTVTIQPEQACLTAKAEVNNCTCAGLLTIENHCEADLVAKGFEFRQCGIIACGDRLKPGDIGSVEFSPPDGKGVASKHTFSLELMRATTVPLTATVEYTLSRGEEEKPGFGCSTGGAVLAWPAALAMLGLARRRSR